MGNKRAQIAESCAVQNNLCATFITQHTGFGKFSRKRGDYDAVCIVDKKLIPENKNITCIIIIAAFTAGIEAVQYFIGRSCDIDDLLLNVGGAAIALIIYNKIKKVNNAYSKTAVRHTDCGFPYKEQDPRELTHGSCPLGVNGIWKTIYLKSPF